MKSRSAKKTVILLLAFTSLGYIGGAMMAGDADAPGVRGQKDKELCDEYCMGANLVLVSMSSNPYDAQETQCYCGEEW